MLVIKMVIDDDNICCFFFEISMAKNTTPLDYGLILKLNIKLINGKSFKELAVGQWNVGKSSWAVLSIGGRKMKMMIIRKNTYFILFSFKTNVF